MVLDGTTAKSFEVRPIGFPPIWFSLCFLWVFIVLHKTNVYENEQINRHQTVLLCKRSGTKSFPPKFVKEHYLFSILMIARNSR